MLRFPILRRIAGAPPSVNTKGLALFLGAAVVGRDALSSDRASTLADQLVREIDQRAIRGPRGIGWGYPFPWQSRSFWAPTGTPNAVVTATVGWQLLECAYAFGDDRARTLGLAAADFLATSLRRFSCGGGVAISYTPGDRTRVVNVAALAARLVARAAHMREEASSLAIAGSLTRFVLASQRKDGSWPYSRDQGGNWEDSFHTGYVLESLLQVRALGIAVPESALARGFGAYSRYFDADGGARLGPSPASPYDAHSAAQGILAFGTLSRHAVAPEAWVWAQARARAIAEWTLRRLWVRERDAFAYRIVRGRRDERVFTRWVQAWMALAMATSTSLEDTTGTLPAVRAAEARAG